MKWLKRFVAGLAALGAIGTVLLLAIFLVVLVSYLQRSPTEGDLSERLFVYLFLVAFLIGSLLESALVWLLSFWRLLPQRVGAIAAIVSGFCAVGILIVLGLILTLPR